MNLGETIMRKALLAALLSAMLFAPVAQAARWTSTPPQTYQEFLQAHEQWDRTAVVKDKEGKVLHDFGKHGHSPFPDKASCVAGLEHDTAVFYQYLKQLGLDIETLDVVVSCDPAGQSS